jgi:hypothetical protein
LLAGAKSAILCAATFHARRVSKDPTGLQLAVIHFKARINRAFFFPVRNSLSPPNGVRTFAQGAKKFPVDAM